jgi:hypothetical protein
LNAVPPAAASSAGQAPAPATVQEAPQQPAVVYQQPPAVIYQQSPAVVYASDYYGYPYGYGYYGYGYGVGVGIGFGFRYPSYSRSFGYSRPFYGGGRVGRGRR